MLGPVLAVKVGAPELASAVRGYRRLLDLEVVAEQVLRLLSSQARRIARQRAGGLASRTGFEALRMSFGSESRSKAAVERGDLVARPWQSQLPGLQDPLPPGLPVKPIWCDAVGGLVFLSGSLLRSMLDARWEERSCSGEQVKLAGELR
jgi:hypothetical protein